MRLAAAASVCNPSTYDRNFGSCWGDFIRSWTRSQLSAYESCEVFLSSNDLSDATRSAIGIEGVPVFLASFKQ